MRNPFVADETGRKPIYLAGRQRELDAIDEIAERDLESYKKNLLITGLRGVGKSVLLGLLEERAKANGWKVISISVTLKLGENEREFLKEIVERLRGILINELKYNEDEVTKKFIEVQRNAPSSLEAKAYALIEYSVKEVISAKNKGIMIAFDEAQLIKDTKGEYARSTILNLLTLLQKNQVSIYYVFVGVPTLLGDLQESKPNVERGFAYYFKISNLNNDESKQLILKTLQSSEVKFENELVDYVVKKSAGYPYFIQYFCSRLIDSDSAKNLFTLKDFKDLEPNILKDLDERFYESRFNDITKVDKEYFLASAALEKPFKPKDLEIEYNKLHPESEKNSTTIRQALHRLVNKGLLLRGPDGYTYTIPLMEQHIQRLNVSKEKEISIDDLL